MGTVEEVGKVANTTVDALRGSPVTIGLLVINGLFLGLIAYILGEVAGNEGERAKAQAELIVRLVTDVRDCRAGPKPTSFELLSYPPSLK